MSFSGNCKLHFSVRDADAFWWMSKTTSLDMNLNITVSVRQHISTNFAMQIVLWIMFKKQSFLALMMPQVLRQNYSLSTFVLTMFGLRKLPPLGLFYYNYASVLQDQILLAFKGSL